MRSRQLFNNIRWCGHPHDLLIPLVNLYLNDFYLYHTTNRHAIVIVGEKIAVYAMFFHSFYLKKG